MFRLAGFFDKCTICSFRAEVDNALDFDYYFDGGSGCMPWKRDGTDRKALDRPRNQRRRFEMSEQPESKIETEEKKDKGAKPLSEDEARGIAGGFPPDFYYAPPDRPEPGPPSSGNYWWD